jgi:hypothetical protein
LLKEILFAQNSFAFVEPGTYIKRAEATRNFELKKELKEEAERGKTMDTE